VRRSMRKTAVTGVTCLALSAAFAAGAGSASAAPRSAIPGSQPSWATAKALKTTAATGDVVHARVYLPWRNQSSLDALTTAVSTPGSASYGKFLSAQQFRQQFAPAQADVVAVQKWLRDAGFTLVDTPGNDHYVAVEGTVAQAQSAFGTTLGMYSAYGQTLRAPEVAPTVPAELAGKVSAVVGLDDSAKLMSPYGNNGNGNSPKQNHGAPGVGFRAGTPCAGYYGASTVTTDFKVYDDNTTPLAPCGYTPAQVRGLYGLTDTDTGDHQTVAFVGANASPTLVQDVTTYSAKHGLPAPSIREIVPPGVYKHPDTPQQVPGDYYGEETLDAEAIHTTAPDADLLYVGSSNAYQDFDVSINHIVDRHLASIISISYGFGGEGVPQGYINSLDKTFQEAVATGIGIFVSSGDSGDELATTGTAQPDFYANDPNVTAVGGTSASIVRSDTAPRLGLTGTGTDGKADPAYGGNGTPATDAASNWTRGFEVGWQTGQANITSPTGIDPQVNGSPAYTLPGTLDEALPGHFNGGAGGGVSRVFARPDYQTAAGIQTAGRAVPDISALADPNTGFLVGQTQKFSDGTYYDEYRIGGTSLAAPLMAGIAAVLNQKNGAPLGFLNPLIYRAYAGGAGSDNPLVPGGSTAALYDADQQDQFCGGADCTTDSPVPAVVRVNFADNEGPGGGLTYSVRTLEADSLTLLDTVRDYDGSTGVGTPNGDAFVAAVIAASKSPAVAAR
jgi:subtilase family serine protease